MHDSAARPEEAGTLAESFDQICDRFEEAWHTWHAGPRPVMEHYLARRAPQDTRQLFDELLRIELFYCYRKGESIIREDYLARFPTFAEAIDGVLADKSRWQLLPTGQANAATVVPQAAGPPSSRALQVQCPHCRERVEVVADGPVSGIVCRVCGSQFSLVHDPQEGSLPETSLSLGHFQLMTRLGVGAFGTVWQALDRRLNRLVAVKIPRRGRLDHQHEEAFLREARIAGHLRHPNIVAVHEVGRVDDTLYIVSDLVHGTTLSDWSKDRRPTTRAAVTMVLTICRALHAAHQAGVIHRDLKPSNILVDDRNQPHITDFGLAKHDRSEATLAADGQILGTPAFMSPEQAAGRGHHADRRTDIYSLGVILFQLLTGELPFRGNITMIQYQLLHDEPPSPRRLNDRIPRDLDTICLKCLRKEPEHRYETAEEVAAELQRFLDGIPIIARPISRSERVTRWCRRRPAAALAIGLTAILAIAGPLAAVRQWSDKQTIGQLNGRLQQKIAELNAQNVGLQKDVATARRAAERITHTPTAEHLSPAYMNICTIARERLLQALPLIQANGSAPPEDLAYGALALALIQQRLGEFQASIPLFEQARDRLQLLCADHPQDLEWPELLAECHEGLGTSCQSLQQLDAAAQSLEMAHQLRTRLVERSPNVMRHAKRAEGTILLQRVRSARHDYQPLPPNSGNLAEKLAPLWPDQPQAWYQLVRDWP